VYHLLYNIRCNILHVRKFCIVSEYTTHEISTNYYLHLYVLNKLKPSINTYKLQHSVTSETSRTNVTMALNSTHTSNTASKNRNLEESAVQKN